MNNKTENFSPEEFVENLLNEGSQVTCDETLESFKNTNVPPYYDEKLYKRGQAFFYENMYGMLLGKFLGLISVIALPEGLRILIMTKMTGSAMSAYRRYLTTIYHVKAWYDYDFRPGSRLLASIADVKQKHNSASKQSIRKLKYRITQKDMALTQFGFIGFALIRSDMVGIHNPKEEDLKAFIHVWKVLGYVLGIEDRFNICRNSVKETKDICKILIKKIFTPILENPEKELVYMANYIIEGMAVVDPFIDYDFCMTYIQMLLENTKDYNNIKNPNYKNISLMVKIKLSVTSAILYSLKYKIFRLLSMYTSLLKLWFMQVFPLLAYIKFGFENGHVDFLKVINVKTKKN